MGSGDPSEAQRGAAEVGVGLDGEPPVGTAQVAVGRPGEREPKEEQGSGDIRAVRGHGRNRRPCARFVNGGGAQVQSRIPWTAFWSR